MPELPEVETIRGQLARVMVGQTIVAVRVRNPNSFQGNVDALLGKTIERVGRTAKILTLLLSDGVAVLVHLKMTGQLIYEQKIQTSYSKLQSRFEDHKSHFAVGGRIIGGHPTADWVATLPSKHTRVILELSWGRLFFNDMRMFGWVRVVRDSWWQQQRAEMAPDIIDPDFTYDYFASVLQTTRRAIKVVLMDQKKMGGVGNIYANDALWRAGVDPRRPAQSLSSVEVKRLHAAVRDVIEKGIALGGASESDYVDTRGLGGRYQEHFLTYKRDGLRCGRRGCGGKVEKIYLGGRGTYYCSECQL